ncbi:MAG TPA: tRNA lysidine(34) synthetase TilS [Gemmatimonadaceae bacterium]|nr:tRNA lysidine(34) synthetase TilS [Gemmatimonadaceae bacterium]
MPAPSIEAAVQPLAAGLDPLVLAVSGGLDSMALLDAVAGAVPAHRLTVATFDHGTGEAARRAVALVLRTAAARGIAAVSGGGHPLPPAEAAWRAVRWRFLRETAAPSGARIVTAHTEDDQVETVVMRALRGAGARGLAGLQAPSDVLRPFIHLSRAALEAYAAARGLEWVDDPSNTDMRFLRNRVRRDLVPAMERVRPGLRGELLALSGRAAAWRREMDAIAEACCPSVAATGGGLVVAASSLVGYDAASLAVLWPSIAARVGLALDRRGTRRLAEFTKGGGAGAVMPLSGGWLVERTPVAFALRRVPQPAPGPSPLPLTGSATWGRWIFRSGGTVATDDPWGAVVPAGRPLMVRAWAAADRMPVGDATVRVKRLLVEAGIPAADRAGWPVVVAGEAIVWIPGVSRARAATARSGRPGVCFRCEPSNG